MEHYGSGAKRRNILYTHGGESIEALHPTLISWINSINNANSIFVQPDSFQCHGEKPFHAIHPFCVLKGNCAMLMLYRPSVALLRLGNTVYNIKYIGYWYLSLCVFGIKNWYYYDLSKGIRANYVTPHRRSTRNHRQSDAPSETLQYYSILLPVHSLGIA